MEDEIVVVYATDSLADGYLAKGRLEAEGIPVMTRGELEGPYRAGSLELLVLASAEAQARAILAGVAELATGDDVDVGRFVEDVGPGY